MWLHDMNGGTGGGVGGVHLLLFLLIYATTFFILGKKQAGVWGGVIAVGLSIGVPLLLDARSQWFPMFAFVYMFLVWVVTVLTWFLIASVIWISTRHQKTDARGSAADVSRNK